MTNRAAIARITGALEQLDVTRYRCGRAPDTIEAAIAAAVSAYAAKVRIEAPIQYALNCGTIPTDEQFGELERARVCAFKAHRALHDSISPPNEPPEYIPANPDVHAQSRKGRR